MKYSDDNVQYLLRSLDGFSTANVHCYRPGNTIWTALGRLRVALRDGRHDEYPQIAAEYNICLCKMCHAPTTYKGTKLCDYCHNMNGLEQMARWTSTKMGVASLREIKDRIESLLKDIE